MSDRTRLSCGRRLSRHFEPRDYQRIGAQFLLEHHRCNLWAVPGLGKTAMSYMALDTLKLAGSNLFPALAIAPKPVCELTWPAEQQKWTEFAGIKVNLILGHYSERAMALTDTADLSIINYENVPWLLKHLRGRWPFRIVIADEARRLAGFRLRGGGVRATALSAVARQVGRWVNLTGTPAPNGLKDLWGQQWFVDFGSVLGHSYDAFMQRWFYQNPYDRSVEPRANADREIHEAVASTSLALRAEDWLPVHAPNFFVREVELPPAARAAYRSMERDLFAEIGDAEIDAVNAAAKSGKLLQMASGAVYDNERAWHFIHEAKVEALASIVDELGGEPLLVACWFKWELEIIRRKFPDFELFSGTTAHEAKWNAGKIPIMGINPASKGHGVNLQYGGRAIAYFTQIWDLELVEQVRERIGPVRQLQAGLHRAVLIYNLVARDTLDEEALERQESKCTVQQALMAARAHRGIA